MSEIEQDERPRTDAGGFAENAAGKFGGGSESPGHGHADEEWRGEAPGEDDFRRQQMTHDQSRREEVAAGGPPTSEEPPEGEQTADGEPPTEGGGESEKETESA